MRRWLVQILCVPVAACLGAQEPELEREARRIVPRVAIAGDADFFAAWNLDHPGLEPIRDAVASGEFARARTELKRYFLARRQPRWRLNHWDMPATARGAPEQHPRYRAGEQVLAHRFSAGGFDVEFGPRIDWNHFPKTLPDGRPDTEFPVTHQLNRFGHFSSILGPLYWHSRDERYAREFVDQVTDHVLSNPAPEHYVRGTAVWSRLTACVPLNGSWLDAYNYFLPSTTFTPEAHAIMLRGFIQKARYALRAPDAVNRYMTQLSGIFHVGAYFPELKQAADFRGFASRAMALAARDEFYPDSITKELCPGYHGASRGAIDRIVETAQLMECNIAPELDRAVKRTYDFYPQVATPLGGLPDFGDTWGPGYGRLARTFTAVAGRWNDPVFDWLASAGTRGRPPGFTSTRLPWAGFYVMRSGWDKNALYLCLDAGPLGKDHWHEDYGSFECYAHGEHLIAEMGVYSYVYGKWNQYCNSSLSHNVVTVDGLTQKRAGHRGSTIASAPRDNDWHSDAVFDLAWGHYDGPWSDYMDYRGRRTVDLPATHRRDVCFVKNRCWIVSDRLECPGAHAYSQLFHFRPERTVKPLAPGRAATVDPGRANILITQADAATPGEVVVGRETDPPQGWFSPGAGRIEPAPALSFNLHATDAALYDTVLFPLAPGHTADPRVERIPCADATGAAIPARDVCALRITTADGIDYYVNDLRQKEIGPGCARPKRAGDIETDARAAVLRLDPHGHMTAASIAGPGSLRHRGRLIVEHD